MKYADACRRVTVLKVDFGQSRAESSSELLFTTTVAIDTCSLVSAARFHRYIPEHSNEYWPSNASMRFEGIFLDPNPQTFEIYAQTPLRRKLHHQNLAEITGRTGWPQNEFF